MKNDAFLLLFDLKILTNNSYQMQWRTASLVTSYSCHFIQGFNMYHGDDLLSGPAIQKRTAKFIASLDGCIDIPQKVTE